MGLIPERGKWFDARAKVNNPLRHSGKPSLTGSIQNLQEANPLFDKDNKPAPPSERDKRIADEVAKAGIEGVETKIVNFSANISPILLASLGSAAGGSGLTAMGFFLKDVFASEKQNGSIEEPIGSVPGGTSFDQNRIIDNRNTNPVDNNSNNENNENNSTVESQPITESTPAPTPSPTGIPISAESNEPTPTPEPTPQPTVTPTPRPTEEVVTPTPTPEVENVPLGPATFEFDIGEGVPETDVELIKEGIRLAQEELEKYYGGDIKRPIDKPIVVKIVSTGLGNQDPAGGGACCTAFDESGIRLFFDVKNPGFPRNASSLKITTFHELIHGWQENLGCISYHKHLLPNLMNEGIAEYIAYKSVIRKGELNDQVVRYSQYRDAKLSGEFDVPLKSLDQTGIWPGHAGYVAIEDLVAHSPSGQMSLRIVCEKVASGLSVEQAFEESFGISMSEFYNVRFPAYLESLKKSPILLEQARRLPAGIPPWVPKDSVAYELNFVAYGLESLSEEQQRKAWTYPPEACAWGSDMADKRVVAFCNAAPGAYPIKVQMPDGRTAEMQLIHTEE